MCKYFNIENGKQNCEFKNNLKFSLLFYNNKNEKKLFVFKTI